MQRRMRMLIMPVNDPASNSDNKNVAVPIPAF